MANEQNLKPARSKSEARERGRKGGKKSGESRRQRKTLREELLAILESGNTQERLSLALINEALYGNHSGSVTKAFETIRDTIGEKPVDKVMVSEVDPNVIDEVERLVSETESEDDA